MLKEIFSLQSQINQIYKELQLFNVHHKELNISFNYNDFISKNEDELQKQLKSFDLGYKGTVEQDKYDKINQRKKRLLQTAKRKFNKVLEELN